MNHLIRQQYLHIVLNGSESEGLALQSRLSGLCHDWLMPVLGRVLDGIVPADRHLYLDRLEIDAGTLPLDRLEQDLAAWVAKALEKSLRQQLAAAPLPPQAGRDKIQLRSSQQAVQEAFVCFLQTGQLPWSFRLPAGRTLEEAMRDSWQEAPPTGAPGAPERALRGVLASASARKRLTWQFSDDFRFALLLRLSPDARQAMGRMLEQLRPAGVPASTLELFTQGLWEQLLAGIASGGSLAESYLVGAAWRSLPVPAATGTALAALLERQWPGATQQQPAPQGPGAPVTDRVPAAAQPDSGEPPETKEGLYIDNAGLVLLHPFLPRFFEALGIAGDDRLLAPERALGLLHFLATGQVLAPEYELLLPKILCNIPLATPVPADTGLQEAEKEEAAALLEALIRHWEALRSTTPDGLRGTFLIRPGKLTLRDDGDWLLQVESKSYDILLDQLPWGISMIQLPWMARMLWVEWNSVSG